ncbi:MAG TPA: ATP-binding protein [Spirochaetota bacterium]|nr:ATP-binding protein [Spirochaetota bacterium]
MNKFRYKMIFFYTALTFVIGLFFFFFFIDLARNTHLSIIRKNLAEKAKLTEVFLERGGTLHARDFRALNDEVRRISSIINLRVSVIDLNGNVRGDSSRDVETLDNHYFRKEVRQSIEEGHGESMRYSNSLRTEMLYSALRSNGYIIRLAKPLDEIDQSVARVRNISMSVIGGLLLLAFLVNMAISKVITRPLNETIDFVEDFAHGDLARRIFNYSDDEVGRLQKSLNRLADSMQDKINTLVLEQNKLEVTIENINDGIAVIDGNKKIVLLNKAFSVLMEMKTRPHGRYFYETIRNSTLNASIERSLADGDKSRFEMELLSGVSLEVNINPIREEKTLQGVLIVVHDATERKRIMRIKTELVGNLSHELKTPITILKGYLETIREHLHDPVSTAGFLEKALLNIDRQNSIINDMLKLNMLETAPVFPLEQISVVDIITNCVNILAPKIRERGITLVPELGDSRLEVKGNRFLVEEVFFNLIDNAINYNRPGGSIGVTAEIRPASLVISVTDTGIGIPEESRERIFERFYRVDKSRSRATGGTGLGLSIVKHTVDLLGWEISVKSGIAGTAFVVEIPYAT